MDLLRNFCAKYDLNHDSLIAKHAFHNPYQIFHGVDVDTIVVTSYGRLGNNIRQLANALAVAGKLGVANIIFCDNNASGGLSELIHYGKYSLSESATLTIRGPLDGNYYNATSATLVGCFYYRRPIWPLLKHISCDQYTSLIAECISPLITRLAASRDTSRPPESIITIHIRSGDIFPIGQLSSDRAYVQPPLMFYWEIISKHLKQNPSAVVDLIISDYLNPVILPLIALLQSHSIKVSYNIASSFREDVLRIVNSTTLVAGYGSFVPYLAMVSSSMHTLYLMEYSYNVLFGLHQQFTEDAIWIFDDQNSTGVSVSSYPRRIGNAEVRLVSDLNKQYIKPGEWANSASQREKMILYPWTSLLLLE